jgi:hypothetical protein
MKVFLLLILLLTLHTVAQNSNRNVHKAFDEVIGLKNTDLSYGKLFYEKYRTLKDNNQYLSSFTTLLFLISSLNFFVKLSETKKFRLDIG